MIAAKIQSAKRGNTNNPTNTCHAYDIFQAEIYINGIKLITFGEYFVRTTAQLLKANDLQYKCIDHMFLPKRDKTLWGLQENTCLSVLLGPLTDDMLDIEIFEDIIDEDYMTDPYQCVGDGNDCYVFFHSLFFYERDLKKGDFLQDTIEKYQKIMILMKMTIFVEFIR